ncbi:MAG: asparagine synthase (glutamine-hydrolyzing) [Candidatus Aminicenantes bacterium]|nr:asparagine synthase (glutamine-hydrolyzing) [Candidatus Aminicenantes bacterium]
MCGLCGYARTPDGAPVDAGLLGRMCRTIVHRGPDDEGLYEDGRVGLGNRRLSIIDVEGGHQPLSNEDGTVWIAYNGEAYNFAEVRDDLAGRGHAFRTRSDTETIVHAYEEWGLEFVHRFRGMFAFALWDKRTGKLYLFRDRVGVKPLYYALLPDGTLVFGSEIKTILVHPGVRREVDPRALDLYLTLEYVPAPLSMFKGILKLPAGHFLVYDRGRVEVQKYWDVVPEEGGGQDEARPADIAAVTDELYSLLKESVKLRLVSDVPLGAFLSGGVDSSTIVGLMRELGANPLRTFSIGFKDETYNELAHARRIAERFETAHEEFILEPRALELTEKLVRHLDEPLGDFSIFPTYLVSQMARRHVTVALSGDGGDEIFAGYEHYQAERIARRFGVAAAGRFVGQATRRMRPSDKKKGAWNKLRRFAQGLDHDPGHRHLRWMMFLTERMKKELYAPSLREALAGIGPLHAREPLAGHYAAMERFDRTTGELYLDLKTYLVDDIMVKVDRMSMAVSLEAREPLLDHKLVEFAFRLPGRLKLRGSTTKWIFKKTVERLLPRENIDRPKEGFSIPVKHWLNADLRDLVRETLSEKRIREAGFFQYGPIGRMLEAHRAGRENFSHQIWALFVFEVWRQTYLGG